MTRCLDSGAVTFLIFVMRYFVFDLQESPKYLVAQGRDEDAIAVCPTSGAFDSVDLLLHHPRYLNILRVVTARPSLSRSKTFIGSQNRPKGRLAGVILYAVRSPMYPCAFPEFVFERFSNSNTSPSSHVRPLFSTRRLALNTTLIIFIWGFVFAFDCRLTY